MLCRAFARYRWYKINGTYRTMMILMSFIFNTPSRRFTVVKNRTKTRLTFLACSGTDQTRNMRLIIVSSVYQPQALKRKSERELDLDYYAIDKVLVKNLQFFLLWICRIGTFGGKSTKLWVDDQKVLSAENKTLTPASTKCILHLSVTQHYQRV